MLELNAAFLWATPIVGVKNPDHEKIKPGLVQYSYELEKNAKSPIESGVTPAKKANLYESKFNLFKADLPEIKALRDFCGRAVSQAVYELARRASPNREPLNRLAVDLHESWVHITRDGGYHEVHYHPNCSWCGIYYLEPGDCTMDPPNGINRFFAPVDLGYEDIGSQAYPQTPVSYPPEEGRLCLFPSYVRHLAAPYRGKRDRIILSFNSRVFSSPQ